MFTSQRSTDGDRARLALEQARLLVQYLEQEDNHDYAFIRTHAVTLLQLVDGFDEDGFPVE